MKLFKSRSGALILLLCTVFISPFVSAGSLVIDSRMTRESALEKPFPPFIPTDVKAEQTLLNVRYYGFDRKIHQGQIVVHRALASDVRQIFRLMLAEKFPIHSVIPVAHPQFGWDDYKSMAANNTSGFNYRYAEGTRKWSKHASGRAIDINPMLNPYIKGKKILPKGAAYRPDSPGTLTPNAPVVTLFRRLGWQWGGNWRTLKDYQHFQKP